MKKIGLFLSSHPENGGVFQYSLSILNAFSNLKDNEYSKIVVYTSKEWNKYLANIQYDYIYYKRSLWERIIQRLVRKIVINSNFIKKIFGWLHPISKYLNKLECDLWLFPAQDEISYLINSKSLVPIHDLMHIYESRFEEVSSYEQNIIRNKKYSNICKWVDGILVDSNLGKKHVLENFNVDKNKIFVLPYIVSEGFRKTKHKVNNVLQLPPKYFFYPAQFWKHKNHIKLLKAGLILRDRYADIHFVFSGFPKNSFEEIINFLIKNNFQKNVTILGYVIQSELVELYKRATALVMPTYFGPTNIPPLEAIELDCPVAVSEIYGAREQLGNSALYFDPNNIKQIADILEQLWSDESIRIELINRSKEFKRNNNSRKFYYHINKIISQILL